MTGDRFQRRRARIGAVLWGLTLLTLPWIGADLIILTTGHDAGAGLQPSWLLMACAWLASGPGALRRATPQSWRVVIGLGVLALPLSAAGMAIAPAGVGHVEALARYAKQVVQLMVMAAFALWPLAHLRGDAAWRHAARWLVAGALLQVGYGLLQQVSYPRPGAALAALERVFTSNPSILSGSGALYVGDRFVDVPRLRGTACEPLYLGNYLLLAWPMIALTAWRRAVRAACAAALLLLLLLTWSRGAWLGAVGGAIVGAWWMLGTAPGAAIRSWRRSLAVASVVMVGALVAVAVAGWDPVWLPARRLAQTFSAHDWSNLTRLYSLQAAWRAFALSPVVGIGWGQFGWHFPSLVDPAGLQAMFTWPVVANFPLLVLCETGLVGFGALTAAAVGLLRGVARCRAAVRRDAGAPSIPTVAVAATAGTAIAVQTLTFSQYNLPHAWVALGLLATALVEARERGRA